MFFLITYLPASTFIFITFSIFFFQFSFYAYQYHHRQLTILLHIYILQKPSSQLTNTQQPISRDRLLPFAYILIQYSLTNIHITRLFVKFTNHDVVEKLKNRTYIKKRSNQIGIENQWFDFWFSLLRYRCYSVFVY